MKRLLTICLFLIFAGCESPNVERDRIRADYIGSHRKEIREAEINMLVRKIFEAKPLWGILNPDRQVAARAMVKEKYKDESSVFAEQIRMGCIMEGMTLEMVEAAVGWRKYDVLPSLNFSNQTLQWEGGGFAVYEVWMDWKDKSIDLADGEGTVRFTVPSYNGRDFRLTFKNGILTDWISFPHRSYSSPYPSYSPYYHKDYHGLYGY